MVWKVKGLAQGKTKRTTKSRPRKASGKGMRRTTKKKNTEPSLLKYEIFGIFTTVGIIGIDTGSAGHSIDGILSYIFGMGRIVFTLSMVVLGLKYIILRKAWPLTKNWLAGGVLFVLFLGLIHLLFIPQGAEFMPAMLRVGGGAAGAPVRASQAHCGLAFCTKSCSDGAAAAGSVPGVHGGASPGTPEAETEKEIGFCAHCIVSVVENYARC